MYLIEWISIENMSCIINGAIKPALFPCANVIRHCGFDMKSVLSINNAKCFPLITRLLLSSPTPMYGTVFLSPPGL